MAYILESAKLVYLAEPGTASVATAETLKAMGARPFGLPGHHSGLPEGFDRRGYLVVTAVRNHFDWLVSWYFKNDRTPDFQSVIVHALGERWYFIRDRHRLFWRFAPSADYVMKFETLDQDWSRLASLLGPDRPPDWLPLFRRNVSKRRPRRFPSYVLGGGTEQSYRDYFSPGLVDYVLRRYGDEMDQYGYTF